MSLTCCCGTGASKTTWQICRLLLKLESHVSTQLNCKTDVPNGASIWALVCRLSALPLIFSRFTDVDVIFFVLQRTHCSKLASESVTFVCDVPLTTKQGQLQYLLWIMNSRTKCRHWCGYGQRGGEGWSQHHLFAAVWALLSHTQVTEMCVLFTRVVEVTPGLLRHVNP